MPRAPPVGGMRFGSADGHDRPGTRFQIEEFRDSSKQCVMGDGSSHWRQATINSGPRARDAMCSKIADRVPTFTVSTLNRCGCREPNQPSVACGKRLRRLTVDGHVANDPEFNAIAWLGQPLIKRSLSRGSGASRSPDGLPIDRENVATVRACPGSSLPSARADNPHEQDLVGITGGSQGRSPHRDDRHRLIGGKQPASKIQCSRFDATLRWVWRAPFA